MSQTRLAIIAIKIVILLAGSGITYIAYSAYRRTDAESLRALAVGFGIVTSGALLAGVAHQVFRVPLETGVLINSSLTAVGFTIIMLSLYLERQ